MNETDEDKEPYTDKDQENEDQVEDEKNDYEEYGLEVIEAHLIMTLLILNLKNIFKIKIFLKKKVV